MSHFAGLRSLSCAWVIGLSIAGCATPPPVAETASPPPSAAVPADEAASAPAVAAAASAPAEPAETAAAAPAEAEPPQPVDPLRPEVLVDLDDSAARADLWARLRRGFAMPDLDTDLVRDAEQWYATRPDYVQRMTERGSRYLFHIVEEVERRGMPTELALLPFIESAFNPQAISSAKASGMWQFMPATGRDFALKQNIFRDDRRDVATTGATCWPPPARRWTTWRGCMRSSATGTWRWRPTTGAKAMCSGRSTATCAAGWPPTT
jgi:membrane-bound lytic murein transglycosylase D